MNVPGRRIVWGMNTIALADLRQRLDTHSVVLFEVLPEASFAAGHLPGAFAMPLERIREVATEVAPDKTRAIVLYCASDTCLNSHVAAEKLERLGYRSVAVYAGGKAEWAAAGLPLEVSR